MRQFLLYTFLFAFISLININLYSQCTPDPSCVDAGNPGEICPLDLPNGTVGVPYSETVTILPPPTATISGYRTVTIFKIVITGVENLPPGITYTANATDMFPGTAYCVLLSGTPTTAGVYPLTIKVMPYISVLGNPVQTVEQVDDTSLAITINSSNGLYDVKSKTFQIINISRNPFSDYTQVGFYTPKSQKVSLKVYNVLGNEIYFENKTSSTGINYFDFTGNSLNKGVYILSITNGEKIFTKQIIKR
ncbi:MAG: T9SS type A sorting domain-containing protein [Bacteroidota bacterium]